MRKNAIVVSAIALTASVSAIEPSEVVRLYRASLTNDAASRELSELKKANRDLIPEAKSRMSGTELLLICGVIDSVSATSTSLAITFRMAGYRVDHNGTSRSTGEYAENNEALILTPDKETNLIEYHSSYRLTPVSFKDKKKGFRIIDQFNAISFGDGIICNIGYVALSDTPVEVGDDDVEMILENGEWVKFEGNKGWESIPQDKIVFPPRVSEPQPAAQETPPGPAEAPANVAEGEPSEEKTGAGNRWLYALIPLCLLAILYFLRKKRK